MRPRVHSKLLPTRSTPILLRHFDSNGAEQVTTPDAAALVPFERAAPARQIPRYHNQHHTPGLYWSSTDRQLLEYESYLECKWMTLLDFDPDVVAMRAQPMRIQCLRAGDSWEHVPDLFVRLRNGNGRVVDVKNPDQLLDIDVQLQAARTRTLCEDIGFEYDLVTEPPEIRWLNISWLAGYRRPIPLPPGLEDRVCEMASAPTAIGELAAAFDIPELARTAILRACWFGRLRFDLDQPLRDSTLIVASEENV